MQARLKRAVSLRMLGARLRPITDELSMPLRLLKMGHIFVVLYVLGLTYGAWLACNEGGIFLRATIRSAIRNLSPSPALVKALDIATTFITSYLLLCIVLVAVVLPVRIVWMKGKMAIGMTLAETLPSVLYAARTLAKALHLSLYRLIPSIAMTLVYIFFARSLKQYNAQTLFLIACCLVIPHNVWRTYTFLLSPIVAVCGQIHPSIRALSASEASLRPQGFVLASVTIATLGAVLGTHIALHHRILSTWIWLPRWELGLYAFLIWYGMTLLTFLIARALSRG